MIKHIFSFCEDCDIGTLRGSAKKLVLLVFDKRTEEYPAEVA